MVGISVSLGDFQLACANCYSLENTKLVWNLFVGVKRNESATSALDTNWLVYFLGKLVYVFGDLKIVFLLKSIVQSSYMCKSLAGCLFLSQELLPLSFCLSSRYMLEQKHLDMS